MNLASGRKGRRARYVPDGSVGYGGRRTEYLTIRVSARGRDAKVTHSPRVHPRRVPLEHHLIEAWPASAAAPREVLKRDETTRYWENSTAGPLAGH